MLMLRIKDKATNHLLLGDVFPTRHNTLFKVFPKCHFTWNRDAPLSNICIIYPNPKHSKGIYKTNLFLQSTTINHTNRVECLAVPHDDAE